MDAIDAIWTNGQIVPSEPIPWPEGSRVRVELTTPEEKIGMTEADWDDTPEGVAKWIAEVEKIEPMIWAPGEREEYERYRQEVKQFNIEAVGKQMEAMDAESRE